MRVCALLLALRNETASRFRYCTFPIPLSPNFCVAFELAGLLINSVPLFCLIGYWPTLWLLDPLLFKSLESRLIGRNFGLFGPRIFARFLEAPFLSIPPMPFIDHNTASNMSDDQWTWMASKQGKVMETLPYNDHNKILATTSFFRYVYRLMLNPNRDDSWWWATPIFGNDSLRL